MAHYLVGRGFFGLSDVESLSLVSDALTDVTEALQGITFDSLPFFGTGNSGSGLSFDQIFCIPGEQDWPWILVQYSKTCKTSRYTEKKTIAKNLLDTARSLIPRDIATINVVCANLLDAKEYDKVYDLTVSSEQYLKGIKTDSEEVANFLLYEIISSVVTGQNEKALESRDLLPESAKSNPSVQYFTGFAYIQIHDGETDPERRKELFACAKECFREAERSGVEIPESVTTWLDSNKTE